MRSLPIAFFAAIALAGCMPSQDRDFVALASANATVDTTATEATSKSNAFIAPRSAPLPPPRPDFEGVKPASRALGALVKEADDIDSGKAAPIIAADEDHEPAPTLVAFTAPQADISAPTPSAPSAQPLPTPASTSNPSSPGYYAAYDDTIISCFPQNLRDALNRIAAHYGKPVEVTSGMRNHGRSHSMHRTCMAADIRIEGVGPRALAAFARTVEGLNGVGTYSYTDLTHVDVRQEKMAWRY